MDCVSLQYNMKELLPCGSVVVETALGADRGDSAAKKR